jgi:hypothetical protein
MKGFKILIWFITFMFLIGMSLDMISEPNTIENIIGLIIGYVVIFVSVKTRCFTNIKFKKKNEGSNSTN